MYSKINRKLIIVNYNKNICVVNLERKGVEIEIKTKESVFIRDIKLFGKGENQIVSIARIGLVTLHAVNYDLKKMCCKLTYGDRSMEGRSKVSFSLAVCGQGKYLFACLAETKRTPKSSRIIILEVKDRSLVKIAEFDEPKHDLKVKMAVQYVRRVEKNIFWVVASPLSWSKIYLYDFDVETKELRELEEKRIPHQENNVWKIHRLGDNLYYTGYYGSIMSMRLSFN